MLPALVRVFLEGCASAATEFLSPSRCAACDVDTSPRVLLCQACAPTSERNPSPFVMLRGERVYAPYLYGGALREAIVRFKYGGAPHLGRSLGDLLGNALASALGERPTAQPICIVPVPIHPRRLVQRGYNSPGLLAARVAAILGADLVTDWLIRAIDTAPQAGKGRAARLRDVREAFALGRVPRRDPPVHVVLVDDVVTTGATLQACAGALRKAGANVVRPVALCCAVAENFPPDTKDGV